MSPEALLAETYRDADVLAAKPIASLMGGPANREALAAFAEGRDPDFSGL